MCGLCSTASDMLCCELTSARKTNSQDPERGASQMDHTLRTKLLHAEIKRTSKPGYELAHSPSSCVHRATLSQALGHVKCQPHPVDTITKAPGAGTGPEPRQRVQPPIILFTLIKSLCSFHLRDEKPPKEDSRCISTRLSPAAPPQAMDAVWEALDVTQCLGAA